MYLSNIEAIKEAAEALSYTATYLPGAKKAQRLLVSNGKKMYIANSTIFGFYPETQRWHQHLFGSKILTQVVLKQLGYNTIASFTAYCDDYMSVTSLQKDVIQHVTQYPVIVKPEGGARGRDISLALSKTTLQQQVKALYVQKKNLLIQSILVHDEYRILVVNGKIEVIHMKQLNHIVGDGIQTIKKLLHKKHNGEKDATFIKLELKKRGLTLESILIKDDTFLSHLTRFSSPNEYYQAEKFPKQVTLWAEKLVKEISVPTIGIDIFAPNGLFDPESYIIIELNANPAFEYFHKRYNDPAKVKEIATKFLQHYFKK
jgi:D-alanine-D-alanine ligase-like ATP-grasp enzyme